jgi:hypothetical protein
MPVFKIERLHRMLLKEEEYSAVSLLHWQFIHDSQNKRFAKE